MKTMMGVILALVAGAFLLAGCGGEKPEGAAREPGAASAAGAEQIAQKTCPVMEGNKINPELYADHNGRRIYFCCKMCVETFKKDPEKYIKKVDAELAGLKAGAPAAGGGEHQGHDH